MSSDILGALMLGVPSVFAAYVAFFWRRRPLFWFAIALIATGLGYLYFVGALDNIANYVTGEPPAVRPATSFPAP